MGGRGEEAGNAGAPRGAGIGANCGVGRRASGATGVLLRALTRHLIRHYVMRMPNRLPRWSGWLLLAVVLGWFSVMVQGASSASSSSGTKKPGSSSANTTTPAEESPVYDMTADFAKNWDAKTNPNGVWKYGWSKGLHGDFTLFSKTQIAPDGNRKQHDWIDPDHVERGTPAARLNTGGDFDNGNLKYKAGALMMSGGGPGWKDFAHVIFTAPSEGLYEVKAVFSDQQHNMDADAQILVAGKSRFGAMYRQSKGTHKFDDTLALEANDTVDFAVGLDSNYSGHPGLVGLSVTIEKH